MDNELDKAKEWLDQAKECKNGMDSFTYSWRAFNGLFFCSKNVSELQKIKNYLKSNILEHFAETLIVDHSEEVAFLLHAPVVDMRGNGRDTKGDISRFNEAPNNLSKLESLFAIIYQVRCNLEHGQKSPFRNRDVELCSASYPLVAKIVEKAI